MAKCLEGCQCGRHDNPRAGRPRGSMVGMRYALRHGHTHKDGSGKIEVSRTYKSWQSMKYRCDTRRIYVERGIVVCDRWLGRDGFDNFLADMGERPDGKTLDRIDNDGDYEPGNCRWATPKEQAQNRRPWAEWSVSRD